MPHPVFLSYTQEALDRNLDQRAWVENSEELLRRHASLSRAIRTRMACELDVSYGKHPDEVLDIFPALPGPAPSPIAFFVHGGAWRHFRKEDYSLVAGGFGPVGITTIVVNFSKLPFATLSTVVQQITLALAWTQRHARDFNADPNNIHVIGHSSGAHLAMACLSTLRGMDGAAPQESICSAACISGIYDLEPVMLSARRRYVHLSAAEVSRLSPLHNAGKIFCRTAVFFAARDSDEFKRQSLAFATRLEANGRLDQSASFDANHYDIVDMLVSSETPLSRSIHQTITRLSQTFHPVVSDQ